MRAASSKPSPKARGSSARRIRTASSTKCSLWPRYAPDRRARGPPGRPRPFSHRRPALAVLDQLRLVEDAAHGDQLCSGTAAGAGYSSNLAFFGAFASLQRSRFHLQNTLLDSSVLLLGLGGVGSSVLTSLAGLGVGRVTAVDYDTVELRNLSRQLLYSESDLGRPKLTVATERARQLNPHMEFVPVSRRLTGPEDVADLLPGHQLVLALVDQPPAVKQWVNDACVAAGVPDVAGGIQGCAVAYYSVAPRLQRAAWRASCTSRPTVWPRSPRHWRTGPTPRSPRPPPWPVG